MSARVPARPLGRACLTIGAWVRVGCVAVGAWARVAVGAWARGRVGACVVFVAKILYGVHPRHGGTRTHASYNQSQWGRVAKRASGPLAHRPSGPKAFGCTVTPMLG